MVLFYHKNTKKQGGYCLYFYRRCYFVEDLLECEDVEIVALCDVKEEALQRALARYDLHHATFYRDY